MVFMWGGWEECLLLSLCFCLQRRNFPGFTTVLITPPLPPTSKTEDCLFLLVILGPCILSGQDFILDHPYPTSFQKHMWLYLSYNVSFPTSNLDILESIKWV